MAASIQQTTTTLLVIVIWSCITYSADVDQTERYRNKVVSMFQHGYDSYMRYAYPKDELCPITCSGRDTWGSYALTVIDALDTLLIMGNKTEFKKARELVLDVSFDKDVNVSVFETNIRVVGGLLSSHLMSVYSDTALPPGWPCEGPLLRKAESIARKLLPAFATPSGLPYGTVNLMFGVPPGETVITCTACCGTFILEFGTLSRLTGDPVFEEVALRAMNSLWSRRSKIGLFGNHINVMNGEWTSRSFTIGSYVDSFLEYLVRGAALLDQPKLWRRFQNDLYSNAYRCQMSDWYFWVDFQQQILTNTDFYALDGYWPGLLSQIGELEQARKTLLNYLSVWRKYGVVPERYSVPVGVARAGSTAYNLRPELAESLWYLYKATGDPVLLEYGKIMVDTLEAITRTPCGYAGVADVLTHDLTDRMESFFLAETLKYLYLMFDPDNVISLNPTTSSPLPNLDKHGLGRLRLDPLVTGEGCSVGRSGYLFNTEAHPIDVGALHCCHSYHADKGKATSPRNKKWFKENCKAPSLENRFRTFGFKIST